MILRPFLDAIAALPAWSVMATETRRLSLGAKDGETGNAHAPLAVAQGLTGSYKLVWPDGRVSEGPLERRQLGDGAPDAVRGARLAARDDPDAAWVLGPSPIPEVTTWDDGAAAIAAGDAAALAPILDAIRAAAAEHRCRTWSANLSASSSESRLATSAGIDVGGRGTVAGWSCTLDGEIGTGKAGRSLEPLPAAIERLARLADLLEGLRASASPCPSGVRPVILHPDVVEEYVLGALLHNLDGETVAHGTGAFRREQFGASVPVLREDLALRVDPLRPLALGAYRFTSEGVPAARADFVRDGRLATPVLGLKYARRLRMPPTPQPFALDTVVFEAGPPMTFEEAVAEAEGGAMVLSVLGVHTQDLASGDFSLAAPQTIAIGPAGLAGRMRATISGNLFAILRSAATRTVAFEGEHTPGLLVRCHVDPRA